MSKRLENMEDFIAKYKVAYTNKLKLEEFAWLIGIKPKSVARRKLSVKHHAGLDLPELERYESNVKKSHSMRPGDDDIQAYEDGLAKIQKTQGKFVMEVHENATAKKRATYLVTAAQNATPVHENFLKCLENYAEINDADIMVVPYRYRNPTSIWNFHNKDHEWWDPKLKDYMLESHIKLNNHLRVMGQISIQPTAVRPLSGFDHVTGEDSAIFGHPSIEQKTIPTPAQKLPKILTSTGALTVPNYTDSKAGHKGEFNHSLAAVVVEIEGDRFYIRHVHGDPQTGAFYDKDTLYTLDGAENGHRAAALVTGDIHAEFHDPAVEAATYTDRDSIMNVFNPEVWVLHDLEDFYRRNHHHRGNDIIAFGKHHFGRNNVEEGLQISADFVDRHSRKNMVNLIVKSNHDEALDRWLREADPKSDPENAVLYHYLKYHQYKSVEMSRTGFKSFDPFKFWCENPESQPGLRNIENTHFLERDESFVVADVEIGFHGDRGPNGARGSINNFSKIGPKTVIGHSHCLTEGHSVLTRDRGWVSIGDVREGEYVLSYNKSDYNEYVKVDKTYQYKHTGKLLKIGNARWVQEVTDYHNMYLRDHTYMPVTAAITTRASGEVPLSSKGFADEPGEGCSFMDLDDTLIKQIVALCADGNIQEGKWVRFQFKKTRKIERLKEIFGDDLHEPNNMSDNSIFKVSLKTGSDSYLKLQKYVDFSDKHLPECLNSLSPSKKELLITELQYWDGTYSPEKNTNQYSTSDFREADLISAIVTELGYRNTCLLDKRDSYTGIYHLSWCEDRNYRFSSSKTRNDKERISAWNTKVRDVTDESVFCIENSNQNFWVRHEESGTVSLTGNSPGIFHGTYQVGVSAYKDLEYASGPSSWMQTHCVVYPDGSRTLIHIVKGKWTF